MGVVVLTCARVLQLWLLGVRLEYCPLDRCLGVQCGLVAGDQLIKCWAIRLATVGKRLRGASILQARACTAPCQKPKALHNKVKNLRSPMALSLGAWSKGAPVTQYTPSIHAPPCKVNWKLSKMIFCAKLFVYSSP